MKTIYLTDGTEVQRAAVDTRDYVRAGLATYEKPVQAEVVEEPVAENTETAAEVVEEKPRRGRPPKVD